MRRAHAGRAPVGRAGRLVLLVLAGGLLLLGGRGGARADSPTPVSLTPAAVSIAPGASTNVALQLVAPAGGIGSYTVDVGYDPSVVNPTACSGACNTTYAANVVRSAGASGTGLTGTQTLDTITFQAVGGCGTSSTLTVTVVGWLTDPQGGFAASSTSNGQISLTSGCVVMTLGASPNPAAVYGQVQVTATFSSYQSGCSDFSAGLVWWYDGGVLLSYGYPSGTVATLSTAFGSSGAHNLSATYDGGGGCPAASAPVYLEQVQ